MTDGPFKCPDCGWVSYHPEDRRWGYCAWCHWWTGDPLLGPCNPSKPKPRKDTNA